MSAAANDARRVRACVKFEPGRLEAKWCRFCGMTVHCHKAARFPKTFCSECGECFGAGDAGFSACSEHKETK